MQKKAKTYFRLIRRKVVGYLRIIILPGFQRTPLYDVLAFFFNGLFDSKFTLMAAAMSYNFFFSAIPALFLIYTSLTYVPIEHWNIQSETSGFIQQWVPNSSFELVEKIATSGYAAERRNGVILIGIFLTLYGSIRGVIAMMKAFTKNHESEEVFKRRNILQLYGIAFVIFITLSVLLFSSIAFLIVGKSTLYFLQTQAYITDNLTPFLFNTLTYGIALLLFFFSVQVIYFLAPATHQRWKFITPGGIFAGAFTFLIIIAYGAFITQMVDFNELYGSLGAIMLLLILFYYLSIVLLIGFELNAAIDLASHKRDQKEKNDLKDEENLILEDWWK